MTLEPPVLDVTNLSIGYEVGRQSVPAVDDVSFALGKGQALGIVGESGSGKSTLGLGLLQLLPSNAGVRGGSVRLGGLELVGLGERELRGVRGKQIAMIFQDPLTSLNPAFTIGTQLIDIQAAHLKGSRGQFRSNAISLLEKVGIPDAADRMRRYPHEFSGGMRQRIVIAMALALTPRVLIADEPTSALDVTLQAQILELIARLRSDVATAVILISHDISTIAQLCDRVIVMYAGQAVEQGSVSDVLTRPEHPYTRALLGAIPSVAARGRPLPAIPGRVPPLRDLPAGCSFADRCTHRRPVCGREEPRQTALDGRTVHCHMYDGRPGHRDQWAPGEVALDE
jgi:oligopeptide/dipeptide ABC transporter ATP-binding protein